MLLTSFILLKNNAVQNRIADEAAKQLCEKLNTKVSISKVNYEFFNKFSFDSLYVEDLQHDTLLFVEKAHSNFDFWHFFKGKFFFNHIELDKLHANLVIDSKGKNNFDFIIKAFQKPKKDKPTSVEFNFSEIKLVDSRFHFTNLKYEAKKESELFDGNRMRFSNLNGKIKVNYLKADSLAAYIESLSFTEKSGLQLKNLTTSIFGFKKGFWMPRFEVSLPNSTLLMDSVRMTFDSISQLKDIKNNVRWNAKILPSTIIASDLIAFYPNLKNINQPISIQGNVKGMISGFSLKGLEVKYGKSLTMKTDLDLNGFPNLEETFVFADIKNFQINKGEAQDLIARLTNRPFLLPKELSQLGNVKYSGNISGFFSNLVAYGNIVTDLGNMKTDILLQFENKMQDLRYNGTLSTKNFQLGTLLASKDLGKTSFSVTTNGTKLSKKPFQGNIKGNIAEIYLNKYNYQKIMLDGTYDGNGFDGNINIDDPNLQADFNGVVDVKNKKMPVFNFDIDVANANVYALKLTNKYKDSQLSFSGNTNMVGNSLDNINGFLALNDIHFVNGEKVLELNELLFESRINAQDSKFTISSDFLNGTFDGIFKYSTLPQTIKALVENYIPALSGKAAPNRNVKGGNNFLNIDLTLSDTKKISEVLELPFTIDGNTLVKGYIDDRKQSVMLNAETPFISFGNKKLQDINISLDNKNHKLNLQGKAGFYFKKDLVNLNLKATAANDSLYTQLGWHNSDSANYEGEFQAVTKFNKIEDLTTAQINILPTQVLIADTIWDLKPSKITLKTDSSFLVENFKFQNENQYITLDGLISRKQQDGLKVEMNELQIGYILDLLNLKTISIKGKSSGNVNVYSLMKQPIFEADLTVRDVILNDTKIGNALIHSTWNNQTKEINASGTFFDKDNKKLAIANGVYVPKKDSLDFIFNTEKLNLAFLQRYMQTIASNIQGVGTGTVRMYGPSKTLGFEGKIFAENAKATIDYLKTTYSFSDSVYLTRKSITFKNITILDKDKNTGILNGYVTHNGIFKDMKYDVKVTTRNLLALNTKVTDNDFYYGTAYAAGNVHIYGTETDVYFDINLVSRPKTKFYLSIGSAEIANENDFITFVNKSPQKTEKEKKIAVEEKTSNIYLNMMMDVNPDANIQLVIDPKGGDNISAVGNGNLRLTYDPNNESRLYGGYTIEKGNYLFTLQNLLRKEFKIEQGSSITWSGDPFQGKLDIKAIYPVTASLKDLMDETLMSSSTRSSVPVNVYLNITDELLNPTIKFDIDLPSSDETIKYQVKNLINTQDMMSMQVGYLLLFGKFFTPDYARTVATSTTNNTMSLFSSAALGTAFSQLNSMLSQFSNNLTVGFNARNVGYGTNTFSNLEYEGQLFYQPNNRLIINGNFGYINDNLIKNKFISDVDLEYILTNNGKLRVKAYNHTFDRYTIQLRSSQFIQGAGIVYKESFNSWEELMRQYLRLSFNKKPETKPDSISNETK